MRMVLSFLLVSDKRFDQEKENGNKWDILKCTNSEFEIHVTQAYQAVARNRINFKTKCRP